MRLGRLRPAIWLRSDPGCGSLFQESLLGKQLGLKQRRPPWSSAFRCFFWQVDVVAICAVIRNWTIAQIPARSEDNATGQHPNGQSLPPKQGPQAQKQEGSSDPYQRKTIVEPVNAQLKEVCGQEDPVEGGR